jgi:hypothetical protein
MNKLDQLKAAFEAKTEAVYICILEGAAIGDASVEAAQVSADAAQAAYLAELNNPSCVV